MRQPSYSLLRKSPAPPIISPLPTHTQGSPLRDDSGKSALAEIPPVGLLHHAGVFAGEEGATGSRSCFGGGHGGQQQVVEGYVRKVAVGRNGKIFFNFFFIYFLLMTCGNSRLRVCDVALSGVCWTARDHGVGGGRRFFLPF